jgi:hypothetical protein
MTTSTAVARAPEHAGDPIGRTSVRGTIPALLLAESVALLLQALAAALSRRGDETAGLVATFTAVALAFAWPMGVLVTTRLTPRARTAAVLALGIVPALQWRATDPLLLTGFDEQLHVRTLVDITTSHGLGQANPLLEVSPHYPGLEALTALFEQLGLPMVAAATVTILLARIMMVLVLSRAVEDLTGSVRAAGLAVAAYATSQQFYFFNSQFAYETLAVPLALAAVACIVRGRRSADSRPAMWGAAICIVAVIVTHHVTGLLLTMFLLVWALCDRRHPGRRALWRATLVAVVATVAWSASQWSALMAYFGPVIRAFFSELHGSGQKRQAFADPSGLLTPVWERLAVLSYAGLICLLTVRVTLPWLLDTGLGRALLRQVRHDSDGRLGRLMLQRPAHGPRPRLLIVLLALCVPVTFAARSLPQAAELSNRGTTFLFLPLGFLVAIAFVRYRDLGARMGGVARCTAVLLATVLYVGGIVLGNGPDWQRLPGEWLAAAENRSMDTETLAAVRWADDRLPPGSRIAADRISGDLLAADARMWVVSGRGHHDPAALYFPQTWDVSQLHVIRQLHLQYLYVDERLSTQLPHVGVYFHAGETPTPQKLTREALTKWDTALGISIAYRHGPVTIYDLSGLDVGPRTTGWTGSAPLPGLLGQLGLGLLAGLAVLGISRAWWGAGVRNRLRRLWRTLGPALVWGVAVSAMCVVSVVALLAHIWAGPATFAALATVVLVGHRHDLVARLRRFGTQDVPRMSLRIRAVVLLGAAVVAIATVLAVESARLTDVTAVEHILGYRAGQGGDGQ